MSSISCKNSQFFGKKLKSLYISQKNKSNNLYQMQYMPKEDENLFVGLYYRVEHHGEYFIFCINKINKLAFHGYKFSFPIC